MNFKLILFVRVCMGLLGVSWYVPDETWQSVEVAHNTVYNTGKETVTTTAFFHMGHILPSVFCIYIFILIVKTQREEKTKYPDSLVF